MLDCILKGWWRSLMAGYRVSGHDYEDIETYENVTITISQCSHCGDTTIRWIANEKM